MLVSTIKLDYVILTFQSQHILHFHRHPDPSMRPEPKSILKALVRKPEVLMSVPTKAVSANSQAGILGAPLKAAAGLYLDLQKMYSTA